MTTVLSFVQSDRLVWFAFNVKLEKRIADLLRSDRDTRLRMPRKLGAAGVVVFACLLIAAGRFTTWARPARVPTDATTEQQSVDSRQKPTDSSQPPAATHAPQADRDLVGSRSFPSSTRSFLLLDNIRGLIERRDKLGLKTTTPAGMSRGIAELIGTFFAGESRRPENELGVPLELVCQPSTMKLAIACWGEESDLSWGIIIESNSSEATKHLHANISRKLASDSTSVRQTIAAQAVTTFKSSDDRTRTLFELDGKLCLTSGASGAGDLIRCARGEKQELHQVADFASAMQRTRLRNQGGCTLQWYRNSLAATPTRLSRRNSDPWTIVMRDLLHKTVKCAGGAVALANDFGPAVEYKAVVLSRGDLETVYKTGLQFPKQRDLVPEAWVPAKVATYSTFHWKIQDAIPLIAMKINEVIDSPGFFDDVLKSFRDDPNGPKVDLRRELFSHLGQRVSVVTGVDGNPQQSLFVIHLLDVEKVKAALAKLFETDPTVRVHESADTTLYELEPFEGNDGEPLDSAGVCVIENQLVFSPRFSTLQSITGSEKKPALRNHVNYRRLVEVLDGQAQSSFRMFSLGGDLLPLTFLELIKLRAGKDLGNRAKENADSLPWKKLAGAMTVSEVDDGWEIAGFSVTPAPLQ